MSPRAGGAALLALGTGVACAVTAGGMRLVEVAGPALSARGPAVVETLFTLAIFGPLALIAVVAARMDGARAAAAGVTPARWAAAGTAIGAGGLAAAMLDARLAGTLMPGREPVQVAVLLWGALVVLAQAGAEEMFFRGWLQAALLRRWGAPVAVAAAAAAFSLAHLAGGARGPITLLNLYLGGLVFGLLALRTGGIAAATFAHWGWNASEQLVWGLDPNPGVGSFGALFDRDLTGPGTWGGSAEGLNAGWPMTFALAAILVPLLLSARRAAGGQAPSISPAPAPAPYPFDPVP